jgi:hypothetical protein
MLDWKRLIPAAGLALVVSGCAVVTNTGDEKSPEALAQENEELKTSASTTQEWRRNIIQFEDRISRLDAILEPLAPLKEKNMELMATNAREGEEAGGGALSEIFYLVQTAYSELDLQAANVATDVNGAFSRDDFVQTYLYGLLEDKVVDVTLGVAEVVQRRSSHMATDRRLVTARLKALNECFLALKHLSENKVFDLSYRQRLNLLEKSDVIRVEYAKTLKTDFFPAIPHFVPLASGDDYLKGLDKMSSYIADASVLFVNANAARSGEITKELKADLKHKKDILKADSVK